MHLLGSFAWRSAEAIAWRGKVSAFLRILGSWITFSLTRRIDKHGNARI